MDPRKIKEVFKPLEVNETHKHQIVYLLMIYGPVWVNIFKIIDCWLCFPKDGWNSDYGSNNGV